MYIYTVIQEDNNSIVPRTTILKVFKSKDNAEFYKRNLDKINGDVKPIYTRVERHKVGDA